MIAGVVYFYMWYVHSINLFMRETEEMYLPPYSFATRILPDYDKQAEWVEAAPMPTERTNVGGAVIGRKIYVVGGLDGFGRALDTVEVFDVVKNIWSTALPLPEALHQVEVVSYGGKLYAFGGFDGLRMKAVDSMYIYDPEVGTWSQGAAMPSALGATSVVVYEDLMHVFAGRGPGGPTEQYYVYDPLKNEWEKREDMIATRDHHGAVEVNGAFYVVGGRTGSIIYNLTHIDKFDAREGLWERLEPMPAKQSGGGVVELNGEILVFGGESATATSDRVYAYDPLARSWEKRAVMPSARHGFVAVKLNGRVYLIGGGPRPGLSITGENWVYTP